VSRIAEEVIAIERHDQLADLAAARMARLGYTNVCILAGDGSAGWPDAAPYDAILAAASGSHVPDVLKRQLKVGGALVMPIGAPGEAQNLVRVTRQSGEGWEQESLGAVRFVPLIGVEGWAE
jgi:protein-L-isoaspartate(D-aspartate) O-methyltransferase